MDQRRPSDDGADGGGQLFLAASTVLLALMGAFFFLPLLFVTPAPLAMLVYRYGYRSGIVTAVFTLVLIGTGQQRLLGEIAGVMPEQSEQALFLVAMTALVTIGLIGIVIGGAWREGASRWQTLWLSTGATLLPPLAIWSLFQFGQGVDLLQVVFDSWTQMIRTLVQQSVAGGLPDETAGALRDMISDTEQTFPIIRPLFPGMLFVGALVGAYVNGGLAAYLLARGDRHPPDFAPFATWRFPWPFAFAFVLGHALLLVSRIDGNAATGFFGHNLLIATGFVFVVQGVSILVYVFQRRRTSPLLRWLVLLALLWWQPAILTWFGVLDTWFNFRKLPFVK